MSSVFVSSCQSLRFPDQIVPGYSTHIQYFHQSLLLTLPRAHFCALLFTVNKRKEKKSDLSGIDTDLHVVS